MNPASEDIKDYLIAEGPLSLEFAKTVFVGKEPSSPDDCVTIFDTPGYPQVLTLQRDGNYYFPSFQIRVRDRSYAVGYSKAFAIMEFLHGLGSITINGTTYTAIVCISDPALLDWDTNGRARFVVNFDAQRR